MLLKKYSDFGGVKKKKSDSEFLSYNLMQVKWSVPIVVKYYEYNKI
jgi:hypothetical protein